MKTARLIGFDKLVAVPKDMSLEDSGVTSLL